jgi:hypothetical protein
MKKKGVKKKTCRNEVLRKPETKIDRNRRTDGEEKENGPERRQGHRTTHQKKIVQTSCLFKTKFNLPLTRACTSSRCTRPFYSMKQPRHHCPHPLENDYILTSPPFCGFAQSFKTATPPYSMFPPRYLKNNILIGLPLFCNNFINALNAN